MALGLGLMVHSVLWTFLILCIPDFQAQRTPPREVTTEFSTIWKRYGESFNKFSSAVTKYAELRDSFSKAGGVVEEVNIETLFSEIAAKVSDSLNKKVEALQKIAEYAEPIARDHYTTYANRPKDELPIPSSYYSSKRLVPPQPQPEVLDSVSTTTTVAPYVDEEEKAEEERRRWKYPTEVELTRSEHFKTIVNMSFSSVHVPTSIYELDPALLEALTWSSHLEQTFKKNYENNPTLGWQYFGSSTGFLRQYPAMKWPKDNEEDTKDPDLYDCRTRPWYTAAATSPKNIIILQDVSGSMTGMRRRIAKAVVNTILDTLTENDFVNVFNFSDLTHALVGCFNKSGTPTLVQANLENIREFKIAMDQKQTQGIADYTLAFTKAYDTLRDQRKVSESADCNQAIMLISDGSPFLFQEIFDMYNKEKRIRLFTYLIGREVTDYNEILWMACYNFGYFVHVSTLGEVQEQVLKYIDVMARPMVMSQKREVMWTPVYADMAEVVESEWEWNKKIRVEQSIRSDRYKWFYQNVAQNNKNKSANKTGITAFSTGEKQHTKPDELKLARHIVKTFLDYGETNLSLSKIRVKEAEKEREILIRGLRQEDVLPPVTTVKIRPNAQSRREVNKHIYRKFEDQRFKFVVSASYPVIDLRNYTNVTDEHGKVKVKRIANLLGVVGTDISIEELKQLTQPFKLGVNAHAFAITNNGHIIFHPDFRPTYDDNILKSSYNALDIMEVELVDQDGLFRNNDSDFLRMRREMIDKDDNAPSPVRYFGMRIHRNKFRRAAIRKAGYVFARIPHTSYTLGLQVPFNSTRFIGTIELSRLWKDEKINAVAGWFDIHVNRSDSLYPNQEHLRKWRIHPEWTYCHYISGNIMNYTDSKEDMLVHFMNKIQAQALDANQSWAWGDRWGGKSGDYYVCDRELVQSVVFDAKVTKIFTDSQDVLNEKRVQDIVRMTANGGAEFLEKGTLMTFIATRSGLTRWIDHPSSKYSPNDIPFPEYHPRSIDESWYQRSVERASIEDESFVVSVAFDAGTRNYSRVTATRAVFATKNGRRAPVAVVGIQYDFDNFMNHFGLGPNSKDDSKNKCQDDDMDCFLLDDNAFIIGSSRNREDAGRFFGEVDGVVMWHLMNSSIYRMVRISDFQAICPHPIPWASFGNILKNPFMQVTWLLNWLWGHVLSLILQLNLHTLINADFVPSQPDYSSEEEEDSPERSMPFIDLASVPKTRLRPCDKEYMLYTYGPKYSNERRDLEHKEIALCKEIKCEGELNVQRVPHTNMILVMIEDKPQCRCDRRIMSIKGREIMYPTFPDFINQTAENPVLEELCRIPHEPLYRRRMTPCHSYNIDELKMKDDCGGFSSRTEAFAFLVFLMSSISLLLHC